MSKRRALSALGLLAVAALAAVAPQLRAGEVRCAMDGAEVSPAFRVRIAGEGGDTREFCGVGCAAEWLARRESADVRIRVTDSRTGQELDAEDASYVLALSTLREGAPDAIRVFARRADAERSVEAYGGVLLAGDERPFRPRTGRP